MSERASDTDVIPVDALLAHALTALPHSRRWQAHFPEERPYVYKPTGMLQVSRYNHSSAMVPAMHRVMADTSLLQGACAAGLSQSWQRMRASARGSPRTQATQPGCCPLHCVLVLRATKLIMRVRSGTAGGRPNENSSVTATLACEIKQHR